MPFPISKKDAFPRILEATPSQVPFDPTIRVYDRSDNERKKEFARESTSRGDAKKRMISAKHAKSQGWYEKAVRRYVEDFGWPSCTTVELHHIYGIEGETEKDLVDGNRIIFVPKCIHSIVHGFKCSSAHPKHATSKCKLV